ncbi:carboxylesterase [Coniella lustricola]|uniref:Carboxylic ester hydrolase n=1 Tax=Coniella lustricola TaxID=2025994 RepID=A0A2T3A4N8_9PEZI|nr:carboxylesterase [Coniella lustricola]
MASIALPLLLFISAASATETVVLLYQNDGNWTNHASTPSAIFVQDALSSLDTAASQCQSYGEVILNKTDLSAFKEQLDYQAWLGNFHGSLWLGDSDPTPYQYNSEYLADNSSSKSNSLAQVLCSNSAPLPTQVDTDYSTYPTMAVESNGTTFTGLRDHIAFRFLGVPYAAAPVGNLRFKYAQPYTGSTAVNATHYGAACLQYGYFDDNSYGLNPWGNSEDCLFLNIYTSTLPGDAANTNALKPVMFWIHGGGQTQGSAADSTFDGASLASRGDVVVVTINYRLNIFGYLSLNDSVIPGNYAMTDKIQGLNWVHEHIAAFGGNPNNITIFGQSAGGGSVIDLISSPKAANLFSGAIIQSGGHGSDALADQQAATIIPLLESLCNETNLTGEARLQCIQSLPAETLLNLTYSEATKWNTVIDGIYALDWPIAQLAKGRPYINTVHYMSGGMPEEAQSLLTTTLSPNDTDFATNLGILVEAGEIKQTQADAVLASGLWVITNGSISNATHGGATSYPDAYNASVYVTTDAIISCYGASYASIGAASFAFESQWVYQHQRGYALSYYDFYDLCTFPVGKPEIPYYRCHSSDLYEVFGTYYIFDQPVRVPEDIYYTNAIQDMWTSFARTANPNVNQKYLTVRGYTTTQAFFEQWSWPSFHAYAPEVAAIQYPQPWTRGLPEQRQCEIIMPFSTLY